MLRGHFSRAVVTADEVRERRDQPGPLLDRAPCRRVYVARTLAGVLTLRDPLLPQGPDPYSSNGAFIRRSTVDGRL